MTDRAVRALQLIGTICSRYVGGTWRCSDDPGRTRYGSSQPTRWCDQCIAAWGLKQPSPLMTPDQFAYTTRWDLVRAYPVISGVPDAREATREEIEQGFEQILLNQNLQTTLRSAIRR